ncbi:MAG: 50S ribosomal protein L29 [Mangrovibacterium sp.]
MNISEINELTDKEINERISLEQDTLLRLNMNHAVSPLENPMQIVIARRNIARLKTVLRQRVLNK